MKQPATQGLVRPDLHAPLRGRYFVASAMAGGLAIAGALAGLYRLAEHHVHETMPRVVDCRADESTLECQVAIDAAMLRTMHEVPSPADSHFVVTIVDCNGLTWTLDDPSQQVMISVDRERHCVQVRAYTMAVPAHVSWESSPRGTTYMVNGMPVDPPGAGEPHFLTPAEVRAKLGIRLHP